MCQASIILQAALRNSSRSEAPSDLFSAPPQAPEHPAYGGLADSHTGHPPEVLPTLGEGWRGACLEVRFQKPSGTLVYLGLGAGMLLRGDWAALPGQLGVALEIEERLTEKARAASLLVVPRL